MTIRAISYAPPGCEYEEAFQVDVLCASPESGGIEDVEYEDWVKS